MFYVLNEIAAPTSLTLTNTRVTSIFNNQLLFIFRLAGFRMATLGTGLPTSRLTCSYQPEWILTSTGDPYSHLFLDLNGGGPDLYIASLSAAPSGRLLKPSRPITVTFWYCRQYIGKCFGVAGCF